MRSERTGRMRRLTFETTLKPFQRGAGDTEVAQEIFRQWGDLVARADSVSILVWTGDGSEILEWTGDLDQRFDWARYIGFSNVEQFGLAPDDPKAARLFMPDAEPIAYRRLRQIVDALRAEAGNHVDSVAIGTVYDPGPEFVPSAFKYQRHPEINRSPMDLGDAPVRTDYHVTCSWSRLDGDPAAYAEFPDGIPDGISFGSFLGAQCASFLPALGFDYLWLSNGFGFSYHPWSYRGINFDGRRFGLVDEREAMARSLSFWEDFTAECTHPLEARGTNFPIGVELAKDLTPLREIYRRGFLHLPAPNSPWGALNRNFGVELAGAMSRAAHTPEGEFPFRFYVNDPWFWQNPWRDCYGREPYDIHLPLSIGAVRADGEMNTASVLEILTVDTEYGVLDGGAAREAAPHILNALDAAPDEPGLVTWVYPFDEMFDIVEADPSRAASTFFQDWFVAQAITQGAPVNTVVSTADLKRIIAAEPGRFADSVLLACAATIGEEAGRALDGHVRSGGRALFYGPIASETVRSLLDLTEVSPLEGDATLVERRAGAGAGAGAGAVVARGAIRMNEACSAGGAADLAGGHGTLLAELEFSAGRRAFAVTRSEEDWRGGRASWLRGALPIDEDGTADLPARLPSGFIDAAAIVPSLLEDFGVVMRHARTAEQTVFHDGTIYREHARAVQVTAARSDNALWLSGYEQDTTASLSIRLPEGAPIAVGLTADLRDGRAHYQFDSSFRREVRVFVDQAAAGVVSCKEGMPLPTRRNPAISRALSVSPLLDARVVVHPPRDALEAGRLEVRVNGAELDGRLMLPTPRGVAIEGVTGTIEVMW